MDQRFVSNAQNAEDVVLWRALRHLPKGRYVEVGANHPSTSSITRAFYDRGWTGIEVEPVSEFVEAFRDERPDDVVVQAAVTDADVSSVTLHVIAGTGLSTLDETIGRMHRDSGLATREEVVPARRLNDILAEHLDPSDDIHFMVVDTEGSERGVLASVDLREWRPWILVVEATAPNSTEPTHEEWEHLVLEAGYEFCLFDGLSRFYVAAEHAPTLRPAVSAPANPLDNFVPRYQVELEERVRDADELARQVMFWRGAALQRWSDAVGTAVGLSTSEAGGHEVVRLRAELEAMRHTISWRITEPLRKVRGQHLRGGSGS